MSSLFLAIIIVALLNVSGVAVLTYLFPKRDSHD